METSHLELLKWTAEELLQHPWTPLMVEAAVARGEGWIIIGLIVAEMERRGWLWELCKVDPATGSNGYTSSFYKFIGADVFWADHDDAPTTVMLAAKGAVEGK